MGSATILNGVAAMTPTQLSHQSSRINSVERKAGRTHIILMLTNSPSSCRSSHDTPLPHSHGLVPARRHHLRAPSVTLQRLLAVPCRGVPHSHGRVTARQRDLRATWREPGRVQPAAVVTLTFSLALLVPVHRVMESIAILWSRIYCTRNRTAVSVS